MKIQLLSKTAIGKWAAGLSLCFIPLLFLKMTIPFPVPTPIIAAIGVAGLVVGLVSMIKNKDRSVLTLFAIVVGALVTLWVAAEIAFPH